MRNSTCLRVDCGHKSWLSPLRVTPLSLFVKFNSNVTILHLRFWWRLIPVTSLSKMCLYGHFLSQRMLSHQVTWECTLWVTSHEFASHWLHTMRWSPGQNGSSTHVACSRSVNVGLGLGVTAAFC